MNLISWLRAAMALVGVAFVSLSVFALFTDLDGVATAAFLAAGFLMIGLALVGDRVETISYAGAEVRLAQRIKDAAKSDAVSPEQASVLEQAASILEDPGAAAADHASVPYSRAFRGALESAGASMNWDVTPEWPTTPGARLDFLIHVKGKSIAVELRSGANFNAPKTAVLVGRIVRQAADEGLELAGVLLVVQRAFSTPAQLRRIAEEMEINVPVRTAVATWDRGEDEDGIVAAVNRLLSSSESLA